ncbi:MAG: RHS repeat domain-containing protein [Planctomycetota bacterium]
MKNLPVRAVPLPKDLGNRSTVNVRDGSDVNYVIDNLTNRYETVDGNGLTYDKGGNLEIDKDAYKYYYDYENRIVKITKDPNETVVAEFAYDALGRRIRKIDSDALGRRIRKIDSIAGTTRLYFYNDKWQVLTETDASETMQAWYAYGNYIDEVLLTAPANFWVLTRCYVHDHLYSPAALAAGSGTVLERYEYDAYGNPYVLEPNFADDPDGKTDWANPYYFSGRRADFLDGNNLTLQINRHRYYDYYTGRWLTHDPVGYVDGMNLYEYVKSNPILWLDPVGRTCTGAGGPCAPGLQTCPRIKEGPSMEVVERRVFWEYIWVPRRWIRWPRRRMARYLTVDYDGPTTSGKCESSPLIVIPSRTYRWPTKGMVVDGLTVGGVWNPSGALYSCRKKYKCEATCCYGERTREVSWTAERYGTLQWSGMDPAPVCTVDTQNPEDVCWQAAYLCICKM